MADSYPVGQAPWEQTPAAQPNAFPVGQAPWEQQADPTTKPAGPVSGFIDGASRVLDYPGGMARDALAGVAQAVTGKDVINSQDVANADVGKGTRSAEYLKRLGVTEGGSINIPFIGKTTARDLEGFGLDVATDPLTALASTIKTLPAVGKYVSEAVGLGANASAEALGKAIYKMGFSKIDAEMVKNGAEPISDLMLKEGAPTGTISQLGDKIQNMTSQMGAARDQLYQKATDLGVTVNMGYPMEKAEAFLEKMRNNPNMRAMADDFSEYMNNFKKEGNVDLPTLSQWKTDLYNTLPSSAFKPGGGMTNPAKKFASALASDFKGMIEDAGNAAQEGLGDSIEAMNSKWGTLLDSAKPVAQQVKQAASTPLVSPLKAVVTAHNPLLGAAMEGAEVANTTAVKTNVGKGLMNAATNNVGIMGGAGAGDIARQTLGQVMHGNSGVNSLQRPGAPQ